MDQAEFDKFAEEYRSLHADNVRLSGEDPEYFAEYKIRDLARAWAAHGGSPGPNMLDLGAGIGGSVPYVARYLPGADLVCLDVSGKSLDLGSNRFRGKASFVQFDGNVMPFQSGTFDVVFAACVFHHIPVNHHAALLSEAHRILRKGGMVFIYEHNPLNPLTLHAVNTCPFDENAELIPGRRLRQALEIAGFRDAGVRYRVYFPRIARALRPLEAYLTRVPFGAQYYALGFR